MQNSKERKYLNRSLAIGINILPNKMIKCIKLAFNQRNVFDWSQLLLKCIITISVRSGNFYVMNCQTFCYFQPIKLIVYKSAVYKSPVFFFGRETVTAVLHYAIFFPSYENFIHLGHLKKIKSFPSPRALIYGAALNF